MISIKKLIEGHGVVPLPPDREHDVIEAYRAVLQSIGESAVQACPPVGSNLQRSLRRLQAQLAAESAAELLPQTGQQVEAELAQWGAGAADYFQHRADEVKELMLLLARTAEHAGERDERYHRKFEEFTRRLQSIADLHDLAEIRESLVRGAVDLKACADAMAEENRKSLDQLRQEVGVYQARMDQAERLAAQDPLTGLENRRAIESAIEVRLARRKTFSLLVLDLNCVRELNDACGHAAADEILRQFGAELKSGFRPTEVVGRWDGDKFMVVLDAGLREANGHVERISRWVFGDYTIHAPGPAGGQAGGASRRVPVTAATGTAEWKPGDSLRTLIDRANEALHRNKSRVKARA